MILPLMDPDEPSSFGTLGAADAVFTWSNPPPTNFQGLIPVVTFNGTVEADTPDASWTRAAAAFSVGMWLSRAGSDVQTLLSKWDETSMAEDREWRFGMISSGQLRLEIYDETNSAAIGRRWSAASLDSDRWVFVVGTHTGGASPRDVNLYRDASRVDDPNITTGDGFVGMDDGATKPAIGYHTAANGTLTASRYVGLAAGGPLGPFFTQKKLTPDDVSALYEMGREALGL